MKTQYPIVVNMSTGTQAEYLQNVRKMLAYHICLQTSILSHREMDIMQQLATGKPRSAIAKELYINIETVKSHIKHIYQKLNAHDKEEAIKIAREKNIYSNERRCAGEIAAALENDCEILLTEDMQNGQLIEGKIKIKNPFANI